MRIRLATSVDLPALVRLMTASPLLRRYGLTTRGARTDLLMGFDHRDLLLAALESDAIVGLAWVIPTRVLRSAAYLKLLLVAETAQSRGVGGALLRRAERRAFAVGARHMCLLTTTTNVGARRFYERLGYRHVGNLPAFVRPDLDEALYIKRLLAANRTRRSRRDEGSG